MVNATPVPMEFSEGERASASPFPARTKQAVGIVDGATLDVTAVYFTDKIVITITQQGRLPQWVHVPLASSDPTLADRHVQQSDDGSQFLPMPQLTATPILGGCNADRDTVGQLYAAQIASAIASKNPEEQRLLVVGIGLEKAHEDRETFLQVLELALQCI